MSGLTNSTLTTLAEDLSAADFEATLALRQCGPLVREETRTLQINVGMLCNQACQHCQVDAGPKPTEIMTRGVAERTIELLGQSPTVEIVDTTCGAPELNPNLQWVVIDWKLDSFFGLSGQRIRTDSHCFGCTAGAGSSCGGNLA